MATELTAYQACRETYDLWAQMGEAAEKGNFKDKKDIPGPWLDYINNCPCCELDDQFCYDYDGDYDCLMECKNCPMKWGSHFGHCNESGSPFHTWAHLQYLYHYRFTATKNPSCIDVAFFCFLIADLAKEAMERLEK